SLAIEPVVDSVAVPDEPMRAYQANQDGMSLYNSQRFEDALFYFRQAAELAPDIYEYRRNYGLTLLQMGRNEAAEREFERALDLDDSDPLVYYNLGRISIEQG